MISFFKKRQTADSLLKSSLYSENGFYQKFLKDLSNSKSEVIIESPYITASRMEVFKPIFQALLTKGIRVRIITRDPVEHDENMRYQATNEILGCLELGVDVKMLKGNHHRKLAIIDRNILWEGSLNILSYCHSQEIMRRIEGSKVCHEMINFLKLDKLF